MTMGFLVIILSVIPLKNYTNYSLFHDVCMEENRVYLASNGGIISFEGISISTDTPKYAGFLHYTSSHGLKHNIIQSVTCQHDTIFAVPVNSGIFYHTSDMRGFERYFIPYAGITTAKKIRLSEDLLFVQLRTAILRIKLNGNLNPDDDVVYIITTDSTGEMEVFGDTLFYSVKNALYVQDIFSQEPAYYREFPHNITCIFKSDSILFVGTEQGYYISSEDFGIQHLNSFVYHIWATNDTVLVGTGDGGYMVIGGTSRRVIDMSYTVFVFKGNVYFNRITDTGNELYNGGLWVVTSDGVKRLGSGIPTNLITSMDVLNEKLYCGTLDWGNKPEFLPSKAFYVDILRDSFSFVRGIGNSTGDAIRSIRSGNDRVFIGAYSLNSTGLFIVTDTGVEHFVDFPSLLFTDFFVSTDTLLALWGDGIYRWTGGTVKRVYSVNYPSYVVMDSQRRIWVGTEASGIILLNQDGSVIRAINYELPSPAITALLVAGEYVLAGTDNGLVVFDANTVPHTLLGGKRIRSLARDKFSRVYALTDSALYFINPQNKTFKLILSSPPIVPIQSPDWEVRNVLTVDDNLNLYIGSKEGILVVKLDAPAVQDGTSIRVYPNPVRKGESVTICSDVNYKVVTSSGLRVSDFSNGCHVLNTSNLSPGFYVILNERGEKGKFVVKEK